MLYGEDRKGNRISRLGYGCMRFARKGGGLDLEKAERELMTAYERGVNYFDTAYVYPGSEDLLGQVGLPADFIDRYPHELSGGQRQRIAIAMCLIQEPALIIADEPFSSLDASSSAELLKLMTDINRERNTAFLLITHNIHIVRQICPRIIVMHDGRICEEGTTSEVLNNPKSEATAALLEAERKIHGI